MKSKSLDQASSATAKSANGVRTNGSGNGHGSTSTQPLEGQPSISDILGGRQVLASGLDRAMLLCSPPPYGEGSFRDRIGESA